MNNYTYEAHTLGEVNINILPDMPRLWKHGEFGGKCLESIRCVGNIYVGCVPTAHHVNRQKICQETIFWA